MDTVTFVFLCGFLLLQPSSVVGISLTANILQLIPNLDQTLEVSCSPGTTSNSFREIFFLQLLTQTGDVLKPLAMVLPQQSASLSISNTRYSVNGHLTSPSDALLQLEVTDPTYSDALRIQCRIVGLGPTGEEVTHADSLNITINPEASVVDQELKNIVSGLEKETAWLEGLVIQLKQETQTVAALVANNKAVLVQRQTEAEQLHNRVQNLQQSISTQEAQLKAAADILLGRITNISAAAPPEQVSFNAVQQTERTYASGAQILFESVKEVEGTGYNVTTSIFRPPVAGLYFFTSGQLARDLISAAYRGYTIMVNSTVVGGAFNGDDRQSSTYQQSSGSTIVRLTPYNKVSVLQQYCTTSTTNLVSYQHTEGGLATNFAGYLLY